MKKIKYLMLTLGLVLGLNLLVVPVTAGALDVCTGDVSKTDLCPNGGKAYSFDQVVGIIVNTLLFLVAAVSVIVIIIAGIYYTSSGGDAALVKRAKDALLYAVVGLVVAILAYAIVNFVIKAFGA
jgi:hypothetical protein